MDLISVGDFFLLFIGILLAVGLIVGLYSWAVYNDLAKRWQRLLALAADVRVARQRQQGVKADVARHVRNAQWNEQRIAGHGARRGGRGGRGRGFLNLNVTDTHNGWATPVTAGLSGQGMANDLGSRDFEQAARLRLQDEAALYNQRIAQFPARIVAGWFRFKPWRFKVGRRRGAWR